MGKSKARRKTHGLILDRNDNLKEIVTDPTMKDKNYNRHIKKNYLSFHYNPNVFVTEEEVERLLRSRAELPKNTGNVELMIPPMFPYRYYAIVYPYEIIRDENNNVWYNVKDNRTGEVITTTKDITSFIYRQELKFFNPFLEHIVVNNGLGEVIPIGTAYYNGEEVVNIEHLESLNKYSKAVITAITKYMFSSLLRILLKIDELTINIHRQLRNFPRVERTSIVKEIRESFIKQKALATSARFNPTIRTKHMQEVWHETNKFMALIEMCYNFGYISFNRYDQLYTDASYLSVLIDKYIKNSNKIDKRPIGKAQEYINGLPASIIDPAVSAYGIQYEQFARDNQLLAQVEHGKELKETEDDLKELLEDCGKK